MSDWSIYWNEKSHRRKSAASSGIAIIECIRTTRGGRLHVTTPLKHVKFVKGARALAGTWKPNSQVWSFRAQQLDAVKELCQEVYGAVKYHGPK
jgi:hypothetical protein